MIALNFNELRFTGYLAKPVEVKILNNDKKVASLTLIQNERFKLSDGSPGERKTVADFELWGPSIDNLARLTTTGTGLYVEAKLKTNSWKDRETGVARQRLVLEVTSWRFAEAKKPSANTTTQPATAEPEIEATGAPQVGVPGDDEPPF